MNWKRRLARAGALHVRQLDHALRREFARLLLDLNPAEPTTALRQHGLRLNALLGAHKRATATTFGFLALEMLRAPNNEAKADEQPPPSRADQVAAVLLELARLVAVGATATLLAEALVRDRSMVAAAESAILAAPNPAPRAVAATLMTYPRVAQRVALAHASVIGAGVSGQALAPPAGGDPGAIAGAAGGGSPPPSPPPSPPGEPPQGPPRRSRFQELVERLVRQDAPVRARQIALGSGKLIADVLGEAAREGWGEERTRKALEAALGPQAAGYRARRIARTELGAAQNAAQLALALDREAAGERLEKVWVAIDDTRTRPSHADADDQARPLAAPFDVGAAKLAHPGDPRAPLGEVINCRCAMLVRRVA